MIRHAVLGLLMLACAHGATTYVPSTVAPPAVQREFRGAWVASVNNIDWPSRRLLTTQQQKDELLAILDKAAQLKLNVVVLQVRPACDALYASKLEPWSEYLTGVQGRAPHPFWDPLEFAVDEAHRRGLELHAWFNPFRARNSSRSRNDLAPNHIARAHPEWANPYGPHLWLDPGLPEVRDHSARVILDVVRRYDIDGVHVDDYFYPYPEKDSAKREIPFPDETSWSHYQKAGGKLSRGDWRRDNVNRFVARMYRDVHAAKPWVKVGVSPFGIYRPGFPAQIKGFDQYESLYADPRAWLVNGWVDYLAPQLYWRIDAPAQSFPVLLKWWAENNPRRKMIVAGVNTSAGWPAGEIFRQIEITRRHAGVAGHIHWNMGALMKNKGGVEATLRSAYESPTLVPMLLGGAKPFAPQVTGRIIGSQAAFEVTAVPGQEVRYWLMQTRRDDGTWEVRIEPARNLTSPRSPAPPVFAVRAVDKFGNLSEAAVLQRHETQSRPQSQPRRGK